MASSERVGGILYIGDAPAGETIPEHDSQIDTNQIVTNAVLAGPIIFGATITITGTVVVV